MKKNFLLLCFFCMLGIGVNASETAVTLVTDDAIQAGASLQAIEDDFVYYMTGFDGESVNVPLVSDFWHIIGTGYMSVTVNPTSVTYTLNYNAWVAEGRPSIFTSHIFSQGVRYRITIYIGIRS